MKCYTAKGLFRLFFYAFTLVFISAFLLPAQNKIIKTNIQNNKSLTKDESVIIAKVDGRIITLNDFIKRAEYTLRPQYCKGNTNIDKKIILNSLIAEKLLAMEAPADNELLKNEKFSLYILGRREQAMREVLQFEEGKKKVIVDSSEIKRMYDLAGRRYRVKFFNIEEQEIASSLMNKFGSKDSTFENILKEYGKVDSAALKEVPWKSNENPKIYKALFGSSHKKGDMLGPINIDDTTHLFMQIDGWIDRPAITNTDIDQRRKDVNDKYMEEKSDSIFTKYVLGVMHNKRVEFDPEVFPKLVKTIAPYYLRYREQREKAAAGLIFNKDVEVPKPEIPANEYEQMKNKTVLTIDGKGMTVAELEKELEKHPLVFRKKNFKRSEFGSQFGYAVVDLIRDKYLTDEAYQRGYNNLDVVKKYEITWVDANLALYQRDKYLEQQKTDADTTLKKEGDESVAVIKKYLNPYVKSLLKKYSGKIEINVEAYDSIKISTIDMFVMQSNVPYPVFTPSFPQLINYSTLDYGKKMKSK